MPYEPPAIHDLHKHKDYEPYALALGKLIHAWNHLHETLGTLFWVVMNVQDGTVPLAVWHSTPNDHAQREMLKAAVFASRNKGRFAQTPKATDEILWLLEQVGKTRNGRNDAIHAPLGVSITDNGFEISPYDFSGNPRAKSLLGKEILKEFDWYRAKAETLSTYAIMIGAALSFPDVHSLPERPPLPHLGQSESQM